MDRMHSIKYANFCHSIISDCQEDSMFCMKYGQCQYHIALLFVQPVIKYDEDVQRMSRPPRYSLTTSCSFVSIVTKRPYGNSY